MKNTYAMLILLTLTLSCAHAAQYTIEDLGILPGYTYSRAVAVNNQGQVIGHSIIPGSPGKNHSFLYSGGVMTDLNTLTGAYIQAVDINDSGAVVGTLYHFPEGQSHGPFTAYVWSPDEGLTDLHALSQDGSSNALAINSSGQVTGTSDGKAFIWDRTSGMRAIPTFGSGFGNAYDIDAQGHVIGTAQNGNSQLPYIYDGSTLTDLSSELGANATPYHINDSGQIAGILYPGRAFIWSESAGMYDIGSLGEGYYFDSINGLNNAGDVVGTYHITGTSTSATFFYSNGQMLRLQDLIPADSGWSSLSVGGVPLSSANSINDRGQIAGYGNHNGMQRAFLMTPVPEPASLLALGVGLAGLAARWRRRR